ncbi:MAG: glycine cleavage system protein GcvH [Anaerolineae bacterium]|jgi:glycine cleavage system H protein|nr:glycine cleavage system protein GcvH [Anaerolineae bacterium]
MTTIDQYTFPDDLYYDQEHVWARVEGDVVTVGLSQFGQDLAGEIVYVEVPRVGRTVAQGEAFMSMESGKWVGRVKSPVSGEIAEANEDVEWESTLVNEDPYGEGWLAKIEPSDLSELDGLMRADSPEFAAFIAEERAKYDK